MNRLQTEWQRLYASDTAGGVRALVLELARPADWQALALLWHGVQTDLALPPPAIAVNGVDGLQLWFSLAEPVAEAEAQGFLDALRLRYLSDVKLARVTLQPVVATVPALRGESGLWSAFIARDLAAVFADEPWLDMCPSPEAQADVLSRLKCIKPAEFQTALALIKPAAARLPTSPAGDTGAGLGPKQFLLEVMNDPSRDLHLRIEAARALLPYFEIPRSG
jgi:hypothetical protein